MASDDAEGEVANETVADTEPVESDGSMAGDPANQEDATGEEAVHDDPGEDPEVEPSDSDGVPEEARTSIEVTDEHRNLPGVDEEAARVIARAGIAASAVRERTVSYRDVLDAGLDRETATILRREFSLPFSQRFGDGLADRSNEVTGLQEGERDWVAASEMDWEEMGVPEYDPVAREPEAIWADRDRPTPVRTVVDSHVASELADCGVTSVRQLSFVDAKALAEVLDVGVMQTRTWRFQARELAD